MKKEIFVKTPSDLEKEQEKMLMPESAEDFLHAFDQRLEEFLLNVQPANEGRHGIIFHLKKEDIPEHLIAELEQYGVEFKKAGSAMKVLKIFFPGRGKVEYEKQRDAWTVLQDARRNAEKPLASVPEPLIFRSLEISEETRRALNNWRAGLLERKCEVILMDFIEGDDLLEKLFRLTLAYSEMHKEEDLKTKVFSDLWVIAADFFGMRTPIGLREHEASRELERLKEKCYDFLGKKGLRVHPRVVEQIENGMQALHQAGIHHNDFHERNIMVAGELDDPGSQVFFIDFAYVRKEGFLSASEAFEEGRRRISDFSVARKLRLLIKNVQDQREKGAKKQQALGLFRRLIKENKAFRRDYEQIKKDMTDPEKKPESLRMLEQHWRGAGSERQIDRFFSLVEGLSEENVVTRRETLNILNALMGYPSSTPYKKKRLREFQEQFLENAGGEL